MKNELRQSIIRISIIGPISSGKTFAAKLIHKNLENSVYFNCDDFVDELYKKDNQGYKIINKKFSDKYLTRKKQIDKKKLAQDIFSKPEIKKQMEDLIHPLVMAEIKKIIKNHKNKIIIIESLPSIIKLFKPSSVIEIISDFSNIQKRNKKFEPKILKKIYNSYNSPKITKIQIQNNETKTKFKNKVLYCSTLKK
ncbi:dephospho-CoA kinase [Candidatus Peregrinibacteria bacterium RIFOXYC2_FULL_33_13]|nr:MAG: Dephospho-CoA kinase [Candidatus Peregrinibacteria bacterium GW2011_GWA2_33_10]KKP41161.1 MAG: methylglyoxal synthase, dephospho-CoA kinase [Candidatus Peregrinibacteria bacterium GW2011_GWC2_33_13]OGJ50386.1 MAG: dephospho-CoA kinase [Candidatus Peregrinibacteria bacterium RIFOXYA2_FULL_33_7]OGJ55265.1 MAG: dephospho-CoA kinase [Candidatus Peregrinibacteria bacterium RIFOXYC2_FULL_33_13]